MPQIIYDADKTIDLAIGPESLLVKSEQFGSLNYSAAGLFEGIGEYGIDSLLLDVRFQQATYRQLYNFWWKWARHRRMFALAMNSADTGNTTLDGAAAAGQKVIPVTATAAFSVGDEIMIRSATTTAREIRSIASISAGVSITVDENLLTAFASGDIVRHANYYPYLICTDNEFQPMRSGDWYSHTFAMIEAFTDGYLDADDGVLEL